MSSSGDPAPANPGPVVLIGGSGDVGSRLVALLLDHAGTDIRVVSRRGQAPDDRVTPLKLDITAADAAAGLPEGATVVNLTEATPPSIAAHVVRTGGLFLETSASPEYVSAIEQAMAQAGGPGTGVVCVGAAPGLSTLLAADAARTEGCETLDIGIELGMGRHYGVAATEWSIGALGAPYRAADGNSATVQPGELSQSFAFGQGDRARFAFGIGFAHQGIASSPDARAPVRAHTFLAFDPPVATRLVWLLLRLGLGPVLARNKRGLARNLMRLPSMGRTNSRIAVEARGGDGNVLASRHCAAGDQAEITAAMILATLCAVHEAATPPRGATTIVDHLTLPDAIESLRHFLPGMEIETWSGGPRRPAGAKAGKITAHHPLNY